MSVIIQATFAGYAGDPVTLYSGYDQKLRVLAVAKPGRFTRKRLEGACVITNQRDLERDMLFTEDNIFAAIEAYRTLSQGLSENGREPRLKFKETAGIANPESVIQQDDIDVRGTKYRISRDIRSVQMACLATCLFVTKMETAETANDLLDEFVGMIEQEMCYTV